MDVLTQSEVDVHRQKIISRIKSGQVFIHPTDTIYGLGCNALDKDAVEKIRRLKNRPDTPFSIWIPSINWVSKNCVISTDGTYWLKELPGAYTLIFHLKNKKAVAQNVSFGSTIGIRLPDHWFSKIVEKLGVPIITTSANKHGDPFMTSLENLDPEIKTETDFMIYEGEKKARPSKIVNIERDKITER